MNVVFQNVEISHTTDVEGLRVTVRSLYALVVAPVSEHIQREV